MKVKLFVSRIFPGSGKYWWNVMSLIIVYILFNSGTFFATIISIDQTESQIPMLFNYKVSHYVIIVATSFPDSSRY
jgi:hypothetical protein